MSGGSPDLDTAVPGYELIDAGEGRRLERFGDRVVDRPAFGASGRRTGDAGWETADLRFDREHGWAGLEGRAEPWTAVIEGLTFKLRPTDSGQVGVFPEQIGNWRWLAGHVRPVARILNLFAYTGGSSVAAASAGAQVVHVDAVRSSVVWARRNAELSGLAGRPVRWIVDDAEAFALREARRGRRYEGIILDPPSYGHGRGGRAWRLEERLADLLGTAATILGPGGFVLLTAHTPTVDAERLLAGLRRAFPGADEVEAFELELEATSGARLWLGSCARIITAS